MITRLPALFSSRLSLPVRLMIDAALGFVVFMSLTIALLGPSSAESLLPITLHSTMTGGLASPLIGTHYVAIQHGVDHPAFAFLGLGLVFSALFALNLSFVRHLALAYRSANRPRSSRSNDPRSR